MKFLLPLITLSISMSLRAQTPPAVTTVRLDPSASNGGSASAIFEEISFIPLETSKESLFSRIDELQVTGDYFLVYDHGNNNVLIFHKNGKFHRKIDLQAAKASVIDGFSFDRTRNEIIVRSYQKGNRLLFFDLNGNFLRSERGDHIAHFFTAIGEGLFAWQNDYRNDAAKEEGTNFDLIIGEASNGKVRHMALPYVNALRNLDGFAYYTQPFSYSPQSKTRFYSKIHDYDIHTFGPEGIWTTYRFVFPADISLPPAFLSDSSINGKRYQYINENPTKVYKIHNPFLLDGYLLFQLETIGNGSRDRVLMYNASTGRSYSFGKIAPDSTSGSMPVINRSIDLLATDDTYLYTYVTAPVLVRMFESRTEKTPVSDALKSFFSRDARMDNPVLIRLKIRPGL